MGGGRGDAVGLWQRQRLRASPSAARYDCNACRGTLTPPPPQVDWSYMDDKLLPRFWGSNAARGKLRKRLPEEARGARR